MPVGYGEKSIEQRQHQVAIKVTISFNFYVTEGRDTLKEPIMEIFYTLFKIYSRYYTPTRAFCTCPFPKHTKQIFSHKSLSLISAEIFSPDSPYPSNRP